MTSTRCATAIVAQLIAQGVTDAVLAPGSRSAPLALALARAESDRLLRLHVRYDERSAGFLALGLAKASGRPVPVITTSGTAVGNLLPAVMEAHHSGVPLLVISADRPAAMVGFGANQTTDQVGLFGGFVRWAARLASAAPAASWPAQVARACLLAADPDAPGPVHLNVELAEPLVGDAEPRPVARPVTRPRGAAGRASPSQPVPAPCWSVGTPHRPWGAASQPWRRIRDAAGGRTVQQRPLGRGAHRTPAARRTAGRRGAAGGGVRASDPVASGQPSVGKGRCRDRRGRSRIGLGRSRVARDVGAAVG